MAKDTVNLVVVSHPDDEVLGFGATGAKLAAAGEIIQPIILCGGVDARTRRPTDDELFADMSEANRRLGFRQPVLGEFPNIRMNTVGHLDLVQFVEKQIVEFRPNRLFTHHPSDLNDDHKQVCRAVLAAARLHQRRSDARAIKQLALMEIASATDWAFPAGAEAPFTPNLYIDVTETLDRKIEALGCYRNVMRDFPHPRSAEALRARAVARGAEAGLHAAEAFQIVFSTKLG